MRLDHWPLFLNAAGSDFFTFGNTLASLINASKELLLADKTIIFSYGHNLETACAGGQDDAFPSGG